MWIVDKRQIMNCCEAWTVMRFQDEIWLMINILTTFAGFPAEHCITHRASGTICKRQTTYKGAQTIRQMIDGRHFSRSRIHQQALFP
ncbi:hypothetical protein COO64_06570 [Pseudomonas donghuensis]|nr:hypothetical protein COO64_06570 [Pseudomonas donghuensis]